MRGLALLFCLAAAACSPSPPVALDVNVSCVAEGPLLRQRCTVTLTDRGSGRPVEGAQVSLSADMPSMPLAHSVRPADATPATAPGTYHGTLELEMAGRWVVTVRITGPVYDQVTHAIDVEHR
ncbi:MAG: FixH family protein [Candidatus Rokubacteria bacterium]|nr:FixH family protein [Candidatus Rokubacteria bacterium]